MIYLRKTVILFDLIIRLWNKYTEVRQEAVQQALAAMQGRPKPSLPMPSKRTSVMARSPDRERRDSGESSSDEDSVVTEESPGAGGPTGICPSISLSLLVSFFSITSRLYIFVRLAELHRLSICIRQMMELVMRLFHWTEKLFGFVYLMQIRCRDIRECWITAKNWKTKLCNYPTKILFFFPKCLDRKNN